MEEFITDYYKDWENSGLLVGFDDPRQKIKMAEVLEINRLFLLSKIKTRERLSTLLFPIIRKLCSEKVYDIDSNHLFLELESEYERFQKNYNSDWNNPEIDYDKIFFDQFHENYKNYLASNQ